MPVIVLLLLVLLTPLSYGDALIVAHRGASGYYPEHTMEAYRAAIQMGADFIEPDLVPTKDNILIARHDVFLSTTTNVADVFPDRKRELEGREDWFVHDFTLAEIRRLRARQPHKGRSREYDDQFIIPTFSEVLTLMNGAKHDQFVGVYPELKAPSFFQAAGHDVVNLLLADLRQHDMTEDVLIQSFDADTLRRLNRLTPLPLVMLVTPRSELALPAIAEFADGVGALKHLLMDAAGQSSGFVEQAHELGLFVHAWTFRDDRLVAPFKNGEDEIRAFLHLGIDGFFTDYPDTGVRARRTKR